MKIPRGLSGRSIVLLLFIFNLGLAKTYEDPDYYSTNDSYESIEDSAESNNNKIDTPPKPTYISAIEWLLMTLSSPFRGLMQNSAKREENQRAIGRFLSVVPNPIKTILQPNHVKRRQTFGDVLNRFTDRFKAVYPGIIYLTITLIIIILLLLLVAFGSQKTSLFAQRDGNNSKLLM